MSKYNENGQINTEINHPEFGVIPITVAADDPETAELFNQLKDIAEPYVEPTPTAEELIYKLKQGREQTLSELSHTFTDGSVVQVRPSDIPTFQLAIALGQDEDWVMADDTVRLLTVAEMTEAMNSGIAQAKVIWDNYTTKLKEL